MAKINSKSSNLVADKKIGTKVEDKRKKHRNKTYKKNSENSQSKTNLKRGKLPSNWNSYVETHNSLDTNKKVAQKFPKNLSTTNSVNNAKSDSSLVKMGHPTLPIKGKYIGIDCEMVGINDSGKDNMLARVSLVDENCKVVYDTFVKPTQRVVDYRTAVSGIRPENIANGRDFKTVQTEVHALLKDKVLVGHAIRNDLKVLFLHHNKKYIRDTSKFNKFREAVNGVTPSLKFLSTHFLGLNIQSGEHSSIEDAQAAMRLYLKFRSIWEAELRTKKVKR